MASVTVIGRGAYVTGRISGAVDLEIHGRVDGDIAIDGEVTIEAEGLVAANVSARRLVVRGAVKGDLTAEDAVLLEKGARVVGDVRAARIAIGTGALVRGYVQTGDASAVTAPRAKASASVARTASNVHAAPASKAAAPKPVSRPEPVAAKKAPAPVHHGSLLAGTPPSSPRRPPAPVVPVLKRGTKGALKKKAG